MKYYMYCEPSMSGGNIDIIMSEKDILDSYFPFWSDKLKELKRDHLINEQSCIEDFITVHWAQELKEEDPMLIGYRLGLEKSLQFAREIKRNNTDLVRVAAVNGVILKIKQALGWV